MAATLVVVARSSAVAQAPPAIYCPHGNLLAGRVPIASFHTQGDLARINDGAVAAEGAFWSSPPAVVLRSSAASIDYDLGAPVGITTVFVQADANDGYRIFGSLDGEHWDVLATVDDVLEAKGPGLRTRTGLFEMRPARYVRIAAADGDGSYSVSELQLFCRTPATFPPPVRVEKTEPEPPPRRWNDEASQRWELVFALLVIGVVLFDRRLAAERGRGLGRSVFAAVAALAIATYFNMGAFHWSGYVHAWDVFHYFVGSKYFAELRYVHLYDCVAVAESEDGYGRWVERRKMTDLHTNAIVQASSALRDPESCKAAFSPQRWRAFKADAAYFRERESATRWEDIQVDHGFNGTPVWAALGTTLANLAPATDRSIFWLTLLDPAYLVAAAGLLVAAFGWRTAAIALAVFASGAPERFLWTGGAFLRWDWLFYTVAAIALLKLERPFLGGMALGYALALRVFPGFALVGPLLACLHSWRTTRRLDPAYLRLFAGTAISLVVLVAVSLPIVGGIRAYEAFVQNSRKHAKTVLNNNMGLPVVVAFRPSETTSKLSDDDSTDTWGKWRAAKARTFARSRPLYVLIVAAYLGLLAMAVRNQPLWVSVALGLTFVGFAAELTCYYYAFVLGVAVLAHERDRIAVVLLACMALTQLFLWAPLPFLPDSADGKYFAMSLVILAAFVAIAASFAARGVSRARRSET